MHNIRNQFPILSNGLIYLDSASTTQKPQIVIDSLVDTYSRINSNVHRGMYPIALETDLKWHHAHEVVAKYINGTFEELFFVKNATEGLNWVATTFGNQFLQRGDVVAISIYEHHSNYLPWKLLEKKGIILKIFKDIEELEQMSDEYKEKLKVVSVVHMSNVLGNVFDVKRIVEMVHKYGGIVCVDGTQSIVHMNIDVKELDCDFYIFSGHKVYGPNGVGVVYGKKELLEKIDPIYQGGEMVESVSKEIKYSKLPFKFEAGTPNIADGIALSVALEWYGQIPERFKYESELADYTFSKLNEFNGINIVSEEHSPMITFNLKNVHPHDIASDLGEYNICVRAGYHCAQPLHEKLGLKGSIRVSLGIYNNRDDIDTFVEKLKDIIKRYE